MASSVKDAGVWKPFTAVWVKEGGTWVTVDVWVKEGGTWVKVHAAKGIHL